MVNPVVIDIVLWEFPITVRLFGLMAFTASAVVHPLYIISMIRGEQTPPRSTWFLYLALNVVVFSSKLSDGVFDAMMFEYTIGTLVVALFTLKYGKKDWSILDTICTTIVIGSIFVYLTVDPFWATICSMFGITVATLPILDRVIFKKEYEDLRAWSSALIGSTLNAFDGQLLISVWFMALQGTVAGSIWYHHKLRPKKN